MFTKLIAKSSFFKTTLTACRNSQEHNTTDRKLEKWTDKQTQQEVTIPVRLLVRDTSNLFRI